MIGCSPSPVGPDISDLDLFAPSLRLLVRVLGSAAVRAAWDLSTTGWVFSWRSGALGVAGGSLFKSGNVPASMGTGVAGVADGAGAKLPLHGMAGACQMAEDSGAPSIFEFPWRVLGSATRPVSARVRSGNRTGSGVLRLTGAGSLPAGSAWAAEGASETGQSIAHATPHRASAMSRLADRSHMASRCSAPMDNPRIVTRPGAPCVTAGVASREGRQSLRTCDPRSTPRCARSWPPEPLLPWPRRAWPRRLPRRPVWPPSLGARG